MAATLKGIGLILQAIVRILAVTALIGAMPALAWQDQWRNLSGSVTDGHHEPLKGAVIQVHNESNDSVMSYITGNTGRYSFKRLDANTDYVVSATYKGHRSKVRQLSHFDAKSNKEIDLTIKME